VYRGFGRDDAMKELFNRLDDIASDGTLAENKIGSQMLRISKVALDDTVVWPYGSTFNNRYPDGAIFIKEPFGQVQMTPLIDTTQTCDLNYFEPAGKWTFAGHNDYWEDNQPVAGIPGPRIVHMRNSSPQAEGEFTGLQSRFKVPWNAIMCFGLARTDPPDTLQELNYTIYPDAAGSSSGSQMMTTSMPLPSIGQEVTVTVCIEVTVGEDTTTECSDYTVIITDIDWVEPTLLPPNGGYIVYWAPVVSGTPTKMYWSETIDPPNSYWTRFYFGQSTQREFCLEMPYGSSAKMWMRDEHFTGNQWKLLRAEREVSIGNTGFGEVAFRAGRDVNYRLVWITFTGYGIAVSTDGFDSSVGFWPTTVAGVSTDHKYGTHLDVPRGTVEFRHNAGEWGIAWMPINLPTSTRLDGPVFRLPYSHQEYLDSTDAPHRFPPVLSYNGWAPKSEDGLPIPGSINLTNSLGQSGSRIPANGRGYEWWTTLTSNVQTDEFNAFGQCSEMQRAPYDAGHPLNYSHSVGPDLHNVRFHTWPGVKVNVLGAATELGALSIAVSRNDKDLGASGSVTFDDMPSNDYAHGRFYDEFYQNYRPRMVQKLGQWLDHDNNPEAGTSATLYTGEIGVPTLGVDGPKAVYIVSELQDASVKALDGVSDGRTPPWDYWAVRDAVVWILDQVGIPFLAAGIENTGMHLNAPLPGNDPYWYAEDGRNWRDILQEICAYDFGASIWINEAGYVEKGCPFCRTQRDSVSEVGDTAVTHVNAGWQSLGCAAYDVTRSGNIYGVDHWYVCGASYNASVPTGVPAVMTCEATAWQYEGLAMEEEYFNHTRVKGAKALGKNDPMTMDFMDWDSIHGGDGVCDLGYWKSQRHTYEWADQTHHLSRIGWGLHARHVSAPIYSRIVVPYQPLVRVGHVAAVYGQGPEMVDLNGHRWRIIAYEHNTAQGPNATTLRLRHIGT